MSVLQQQVDHFSAQAQDLEAQLRSSEEARKHEAEDHRRHARASAALKEKLEKETSLRSNAETEAERLRGEVSSLRRELEESRRVCRGADSESKSNGVRLNRALEDAKKYKELLSLERDKKAEDGDSVRQQLAKVEAKATKLERQKVGLEGSDVCWEDTPRFPKVSTKLKISDHTNSKFLPNFHRLNCWERSRNS
jgi:hypothetical protein